MGRVSHRPHSKAGPGDQAELRSQRLVLPEWRFLVCLSRLVSLFSTPWLAHAHSSRCPWQGTD